MHIEEYLNMQGVVVIGKGYMQGEVIVDNPIELINIVRQNDCYISEIRWWEYCEIIMGSKIGYGGPRDPRCPDRFFFAETDIYKTFNSNTEDSTYYDYLDQIKKAYPFYNLRPAFVIKER